MQVLSSEVNKHVRKRLSFRVFLSISIPRTWTWGTDQQSHDTRNSAGEPSNLRELVLGCIGADLCNYNLLNTFEN